MRCLGFLSHFWVLHWLSPLSSFLLEPHAPPWSLYSVLDTDSATGTSDSKSVIHPNFSPDLPLSNLQLNISAWMSLWQLGHGIDLIIILCNLVNGHFRLPVILLTTPALPFSMFHALWEILDLVFKADPESYHFLFIPFLPTKYPLPGELWQPPH